MAKCERYVIAREIRDVSNALNVTIAAYSWYYIIFQ